MSMTLAHHWRHRKVSWGILAVNMKGGPMDASNSCTSDMLWDQKWSVPGIAEPAWPRRTQLAPLTSTGIGKLAELFSSATCT
eukprot:scaffold2939_cov406-Prasinococcus_capsulatus_cf.AAC.9